MKQTELHGRNVCVLGFGRSGKSAIDALISLGANITLTTNEVIVDEDTRRRLNNEDVDIIDGHHPLSILNDTELIVKNPGVPFTIPFLQEAIKRDIPIITEVDLAGLIAKCPIIGITGTNGKTTVTHLIGEFLLAAGKRPILCGNIGYPASQAALEATEDDIMVIELSSFQLMSLRNLSVDVAVFTNIYEAHIDYHQTVENYQSAKLNLLNHLKDEHLVVFYEGQKSMLVPNVTNQTVKYFSVESQDGDVYLENDTIMYKGDTVIKLDDVLLQGVHNLENIFSSILAAKYFDVSTGVIREVLSTFSGISHRMERVAQIGGVSYFNDSKATNNLATSFALRSFNTPIVWIAGGMDRGQSFDELGDYVEHVKQLFAYGEVKDKLMAFAHEQNIPCEIVENPFDAVEAAHRVSDSGDTVLFSPACASWDQYKDYEVRGNHFKDAVNQLNK